MMTVIVKRARVSTDSRASMVRSAASLIRSRGVSATSFSDVLADSGAPRGSIYHHFPGGKAQLAEDAIQWTSERLLTHLDRKSTRLNSSHSQISYAVFCLKKKRKRITCIPTEFSQ